MKAALVYLLSLSGLSSAISISLGGASRDFLKAMSSGTPVIGSTTDDTRDQIEWPSQESFYKSGKRAEAISHSFKSILNEQENMPKQSATQMQQPNPPVQRTDRHDDWNSITFPRDQTNHKRESEDLSELAAEALLKLQNFPPQRQTRSLATIDVFLPLAKSAVDKLKDWDHPIGHAAKEFDKAASSLQERIGGPQSPSIHGNELKLRVICFLRGEQKHKNRVDHACERLHGHQQRAAVEEVKMRYMLGQVFENCVKAIKTNEQDKLLQVCRDLSKQTLDLEKATEELVEFRKQLEQRLEQGGKVEQTDIDKAESLIRKGGFGIPRTDDENWAKEMAVWYLGDIMTSTGQQEDDHLDCEILPIWVTQTSVKAKDIAIDRIAGLEAFYITSSGPYEGTYTALEQLQQGDDCWSASGLQEYKPNNWDKLSAGLIYVNKRLKIWQVACKACESGRSGGWQLRCGSTKI